MDSIQGENSHETRDRIGDVMNTNKQMHEEQQKQDEIKQTVYIIPEGTDIQNTSVSESIEGIYVETENLLEKAGELSTINQNIVDKFEVVIQAMSNLDANWESSSATNAISSFESIKTDMSSRETEMNNYINILKNVVAPGYEDTETTNSKLAEAFK